MGFDDLLFLVDGHAHFAGQGAADFFCNLENGKNCALISACFCTNNIEEIEQIAKLAIQTEAFYKREALKIAFFRANFEKRCFKLCYIHDLKLAGTSKKCLLKVSKTKNILQTDSSPKNIIFSAYGIHPLDLQTQTEQQINRSLSILQQLAQNKQIQAIGEIGFDFRNAQLRQSEALQCKLFEEQIAIATKFNLPVIVHNVRGVQKLFEYVPQMQKLPSIILHCWGGTYAESLYLLNKGINAWFGFGNNLLQGKKSAIECVQKLPLNRILPETDFPFVGGANCQNTICHIEAVKKVYSNLSGLLQIEQFELMQKAYCNFCNAFSSSGISS